MKNLEELHKLNFSQVPIINKLYLKRHFFEVSEKSIIKLSTRETNCLYLMVLGMTAKQIARNLNRSPKTIESYISNIKMKLNCADRYEVITKTLLNNQYLIEFIKNNFYIAIND